MTHLAIHNISAIYGNATVLDAIELGIDTGEMHVLLGPSGCGKTTLLRSIAGLVSPSSGSITLDGRRIDTLPPKDRGIGMVFQHYALFPNMTVRQNLAFGLEQRRLAKKTIDDKVSAALETVSLSDRADRRPHQLSGGQKQRVALARALVLEPKLLLLDEPLSALDAQIRKRLRDELKRIQRESGLTSILVTHDQDEALSLGDRISVMNAGRIAQTASPQELYYRPADLFVAGFIGDANIITAEDMSRITGNRFERTCIIPPHAFTIGNAADGNGVAFTAEVKDISIVGPTVRYQLDAAGVALKVEHASAQDALYPPPGQRITLTVAERQLHYI
ncbi:MULTISPECIES: ABC transporter ATP-binding protein [Rhizobium/Agrobacterium group]|uniref:ABC transporter ATP-binding protein n=1 Tax=Rhizobium rhizogenes TaxID=359 RepID=A0A546XAV0_RHIRH|nr:MULTISPECIES: ABC transporter ATP-binding protein [Rhizobium/Agrobacterium group]MDA5635098.1 ABC transporter ATP-binding protein [Agrobacterium sp. ST15.16.024]MDF1890246.1 ABC transporter ATP-binding protein [Rhizobium rhizogenes]TRA97884.1 ABC transporter ATP-binding protein [Rhizobium rhizogenes]